MIEDTIRRWHAWVDSKSPEGLDDLLADDVTFHSPVVHTPQEGRPRTALYLSAAYRVMGEGGFRYVREVTSGNDAVLEFTADIEGTHINGVDLIRCDDEGRIVDFKVMVRPLKGINLLHRKMGEMLDFLNASSR